MIINISIFSLLLLL